MNSSNLRNREKLYLMRKCFRKKHQKTPKSVLLGPLKKEGFALLKILCTKRVSSKATFSTLAIWSSQNSAKKLFFMCFICTLFFDTILFDFLMFGITSGGVYFMSIYCVLKYVFLQADSVFLFLSQLLVDRFLYVFIVFVYFCMFLCE